MNTKSELVLARYREFTYTIALGRTPPVLFLPTVGFWGFHPVFRRHVAFRLVRSSFAPAVAPALSLRPSRYASRCSALPEVFPDVIAIASGAPLFLVAFSPLALSQTRGALLFA